MVRWPKWETNYFVTDSSNSMPKIPNKAAIISTVLYYGVAFTYRFYSFVIAINKFSIVFQ